MEDLFDTKKPPLKILKSYLNKKKYLSKKVINDIIDLLEKDKESSYRNNLLKFLVLAYKKEDDSPACNNATIILKKYEPNLREKTPKHYSKGLWCIIIFAIIIFTLGFIGLFTLIFPLY